MNHYLRISDIKSNPKWLQKYITQKQKFKHSIGLLKKPDKSTTIQHMKNLYPVLNSLSQFSFMKTFKN